MTAAAKLDEALKLLDEIDSTPLSQLNAKLDRITHAVALAKHMISFERRQDAVSVGDHDPERAA